MPELPDIEVFSRNLKKMYVGKKLSKIKVVNNKNIKDTQKDVSKALEGQILRDVYRSGKEMRFLFRGIGNGYSDEILWHTRISPFSKANAIPDEKIKELAKNIKKVLKNATEKIFKNRPGLIHGEVRDFMDIHTKKKTKARLEQRSKLLKEEC